jgi:cellulose synthase/poly-beta-1,6-N-acetylglucosamine synthase-like glycosyltransferase
MMAAIPWLLSAGAALPMLVLATECLLGLRAGRRPAEVDLRTEPFTVLIPAHDEATGITPVIAAVCAQLRPCDRVLVVADNCADATAAVARAAGAEIVERFDAERRGKAYALACGRVLLRRNPPATVIVLDADCVPEPGALLVLASSSGRRGAAVQGRYLLRAAEDASPLVRISTFAFLIKNSVRQRGLERLGAPALLQGTGMAFPWPMFDAAPLETASLVEDMKLGLDLAVEGRPVWFEDRAVFLSPASSQAATSGQRTRWEHGALATFGRYAPRLIGRGLLGRPGLLALAADIAVPPLMLLVAGSSFVAMLLVAWAMFTGMVAPLVLLGGAGLLLAASLIAVWWAWGRTLLPAASLLHLPRYLIWKLPIYARFVTRRQRDWVRTGRA